MFGAINTGCVHVDKAKQDLAVMKMPNAPFQSFIGFRPRSRRIHAQRKILLQATESPCSWPC